MFAAGGLVDNMIVMAERSNLASLDGLRILLSTHKSWLISVLTATGFLLQTSIYLSNNTTWTMPAGSVMPAPVRLLATLPLKLEHLLEHLARGSCLGDAI